MEYTLQCPCGAQEVVGEGSAGARLSCACGRVLIVPTLHELRRSEGVLRFNDMAAVPDPPRSLEEQRFGLIPDLPEQGERYGREVVEGSSDAPRLQAFPRLLPEGVSEVYCRSCGGIGSGAKSYTVIQLLFLLVYIRIGFSTFVCCPRCARRLLLEHSAYSLATANLLSPLVLAWNTFQLLRTLVHWPLADLEDELCP
jgi:hypothetical protein